MTETNMILLFYGKQQVDQSGCGNEHFQMGVEDDKLKPE